MHPLPVTVLTGFLAAQSRWKNSLTPAGTAAAVLTAAAHGAHSSGLGFTLLIAFYLLGSRATKINHEYQAGRSRTVTASAEEAGTGPEAGQGPAPPAPRRAMQVLANSYAASALLLLHTFLARAGNGATAVPFPPTDPADLLFLGAITNYAAVTADTLSSELGIFATGPPFLITSPSRRVPTGTNGGVTATGLAAGAAGAAVIGLIAAGWVEGGWGERARLAAAVTGLGVAGSVVDSLLGAVLQETRALEDGRVVEVEGGGKMDEQEMAAALGRGKSGEAAGSTKAVSGWNVLSNNGVNALMAGTTSIAGMALFGWAYGVL